MADPATSAILAEMCALRDSIAVELVFKRREELLLVELHELREVRARFNRALKLSLLLKRARATSIRVAAVLKHRADSEAEASRPMMVWGADEGAE